MGAAAKPELSAMNGPPASVPVKFAEAAWATPVAAFAPPTLPRKAAPPPKALKSAPTLYPTVSMPNTPLKGRPFALKVTEGGAPT